MKYIWKKTCYKKDFIFFPSCNFLLLLDDDEEAGPPGDEDDDEEDEDDEDEEEDGSEGDDDEVGLSYLMKDGIQVSGVS